MTDWTIAGALLATHWPYWLAAALLVTIVRQIRVRVEAEADRLTSLPAKRGQHA
jgi:hypothetical protein